MYKSEIRRVLNQRDKPGSHKYYFVGKAIFSESSVD
jgi:hypothetical protein